MILWKCIFTGLLAVLIAAIVLPMSVCVHLSWASPPGEFSIGFDPISAARSPSVWVIAFVVFGLGFYLEYRRLRAPQRSLTRN